MTVDKPLYDLQSVSHLVVLTDILKFWRQVITVSTELDIFEWVSNEVNTTKNNNFYTGTYGLRKEVENPTYTSWAPFIFGSVLWSI